MRNLSRVPAQAISLLLLFLCLSGCGRLIADYSLDAYRNATSLKAETLAMIDKANEPYSKHAPAVDALNIKIDAAYEFVAGIPGNELSAQQWAILKDPNRNSYGGFVKFWKAHGSVSPAVSRRREEEHRRGFRSDHLPRSQ